MAERLATWVWVGAAALACVAGIVNGVGVLGFQQQAITHLTGNTSLLGAALIGGDSKATVALGAMIVAFVFGAMLSGLIVQGGVQGHRQLRDPAAPRVRREADLPRNRRRRVQHPP